MSSHPIAIRDHLGTVHIVLVEVQFKYVLHCFHAKNISYIKFDSKLAVNDFKTTAIFEKMCKYVNGFEMALVQTLLQFIKVCTAIKRIVIRA